LSAWLVFAFLLLSSMTANAREPIEISVLTYNIHGLPSWIARDDPPARIPLILEKAAAHDLVLLQEDFAYHDVVVSNAKHPHLFRGNEAWAPLLEGAGLTILARFDSREPPLLEPYGVCNGYLSAGNDCFGNKGFLMARLALPNGAQLDVWNTHLDAGASDDDHRVRVAQLERLAAAIDSHSAGRALLIGGDFNLEWDVARDRALLEWFRDRVDLTLAAQTPANGWESHLDYLLIRGGGNVAITSSGSGKDERAVNHTGQPLSDHPAIFDLLEVR